MKYLELFAREKRLDFFDTYGDEMRPNFQEYESPAISHNISILEKERLTD